MLYKKLNRINQILRASRITSVFWQQSLSWNNTYFKIRFDCGNFTRAALPWFFFKCFYKNKQNRNVQLTFLIYVSTIISRLFLYLETQYSTKQSEQSNSCLSTVLLISLKSSYFFSYTPEFGVFLSNRSIYRSSNLPENYD